MTNEPTAATAVAAHRAPVIEFDAVIKRYAPPPGAPRSDRPAVDSFSATVPSGSTTVLLGSSGCGKRVHRRRWQRQHRVFGNVRADAAVHWSKGVETGGAEAVRHTGPQQGVAGGVLHGHFGRHPRAALRQGLRRRRILETKAQAGGFA